MAQNRTDRTDRPILEDGDGGAGGNGDAQGVARGGTDVAEAGADAERFANGTGLEEEEGNGFAGVISAGPGGIEAVVGGDDQDVVVIE